MKIAFLTPNNGQYVGVQWAVWMSGGVAVPLCKSHPTSTLKYYVEDSEAGLIIVTEDMKDMVAGLGVEVMVVGEATEDDEVELNPAIVGAGQPLSPCQCWSDGGRCLATLCWRGTA